MESREAGTQHPVMNNRNRCTVSPECRRYCLEVTGCDEKGFLFGQPGRTEAKADEVEVSEDVPKAAPEEDRKAGDEVGPQSS